MLDVLKIRVLSLGMSQLQRLLNTFITPEVHKEVKIKGSDDESEDTSNGDNTPDTKVKRPKMSVGGLVKRSRAKSKTIITNIVSTESTKTTITPTEESEPPVNTENRNNTESPKAETDGEDSSSEVCSC